MIIVLILFLLIPSLVTAEVYINEIDFNPAGTDTGYEWIELHNNSSESKSVEDWVLKEQGVNHKLNSTTAAGYTIPPGGFGIIADNPSKFLEKYPGFPGVLLDSAFSLSNTGELLELINGEGVSQFQIQYNPELGGNGDGSTLALLSSNWTKSNPTPGFKNEVFVTEETPAENSDVTETGSSATTPSQPPKSPVTETTVLTNKDSPPERQEGILVEVGAKKIALAGVSYTFTPQVTTDSGRVLTVYKSAWNFGDGQTSNKRNPQHIFSESGVYIGTLTVSYQKETTENMFEINVIEPKLVISSSKSENLVHLENLTNYTINISNFSIVNSTSRFLFPEGSIIKAQTKISIPASLLSITLDEKDTLRFQSPENLVLSDFNEFNRYLETDMFTAEPTTKQVTEKIPQQSAERYVYVPVYQNQEPEMETVQQEETSIHNQPSIVFEKISFASSTNPINTAKNSFESIPQEIFLVPILLIAALIFYLPRIKRYFLPK